MDYVALINEQLKASMVGGDKLRTETLRSVRAGIIEFEKSGSGKAMGEADFLKIVSTAVKKRKDAIAQYEEVGRTELADKEKAELAILMEFMPQQMSEEEVENEIKKVIAETGAAGAGDFAKVIGGAMKVLKGKADGALIQATVKRLLS